MTFLSLVNKDLPVINIIFTTNIHYLRKDIDFDDVILFKCNFVYTSVHIFMRNSFL